MKYLMFLIMTLMLSANVMARGDGEPDLDICPVGGCGYSMGCEIEGPNGAIKASFYTGSQNYATATAMFIYSEKAIHQFYIDLLAAATQANTLQPGSIDMNDVPDIEHPLNPMFVFD